MKTKLDEFIEEVKRLEKQKIKDMDGFLAMKAQAKINIARRFFDAVDEHWNLKNRTATTDKILKWGKLRELLK